MAWSLSPLYPPFAIFADSGDGDFSLGQTGAYAAHGRPVDDVVEEVIIKTVSTGEAADKILRTRAAARTKSVAGRRQINIAPMRTSLHDDKYLLACLGLGLRFRIFRGGVD